MRQFNGQIDRRDHAVGARDTFAGDFKRSSMIGARAWKR
jgi:hypothetical protein